MFYVPYYTEDSMSLSQKRGMLVFCKVGTVFQQMFAYQFIYLRIFEEYKMALWNIAQWVTLSPKWLHESIRFCIVTNTRERQRGLISKLRMCKANNTSFSFNLYIKRMKSLSVDMFVLVFFGYLDWDKSTIYALQNMWETYNT